MGRQKKTQVHCISASNSFSGHLACWNTNSNTVTFTQGSKMFCSLVSGWQPLDLRIPSYITSEKHCWFFSEEPRCLCGPDRRPLAFPDGQLQTWTACSRPASHFPILMAAVQAAEASPQEFISGGVRQQRLPPDSPYGSHLLQCEKHFVQGSDLATYSVL